MPGFRLCFLTMNGQLADHLFLEAVDESAAAAKAEGYWEGRSMELWQGGRRLKAWPARGTLVAEIDASQLTLREARRGLI